MPVTWPDEVDAVLAGDLTAALAYVTPAGGAVVTPVSPIGLRDREAGTVTFTTSLGLGKKLERIERNPNIALAYHAREHGFAAGTDYVLVQGKASASRLPDRSYLEKVVGPQAEHFVGPRKEGRLFWDRWLREYYAVRIPVVIEVERIVVWPDLRCEGEPVVHGASRPSGLPPSQAPPARGTAPRVDASRAARRLQRLEHVLLGFVGADGFPTVVPVAVSGGGDEGIRIGAAEGLLASGARRAGLLGHQYGHQLKGMTARQYTGWLEVAHPDGRQGLYSPHTEQGFRAPNNKTLLMLANGFIAKRGVRRAERVTERR
jgi:nitroimidazol reductase NimA-like FMN-containing flavoprotein (pyridoxamine 5'-phosphate oxidase superfamily)